MQSTKTNRLLCNLRRKLNAASRGYATDQLRALFLWYSESEESQEHRQKQGKSLPYGVNWRKSVSRVCCHPKRGKLDLQQDW